MTPDFLITADGANITAKVRDRLTELRVTDEEGFSADRFEMVLDDRDAAIEMPATGAEVKVSLGYRGAPLTPLGTFTVDSLGGTGPLLTLRIGGKAADMAGPIRSPRTRAWENRTLAEIVTTIAGEAGLKPVVGAALRDIRWPFLAQTAESNLHFLTRITRPLDAIAKPAGGTLMVNPRGETTNAAGEEMPEAALSAAQLSDYSWSLGEREEYRSVEAEWQETAAGQTRSVRSGSGEPVKKLRHTFGSEDEAIRACEGHLTMAEREAMTFRGKCAGFQPGLFAGGRLTLAGVRDELTSGWLVTQVVHELSNGGLKTRFTARKPNPESTS